MSSSGIWGSIVEFFVYTIEVIGDIFSNPGVGNLLLLIAAVVGVYGSYWLYEKRLDDRKDSIRRALKAEMGSAATLDTMIRKGTMKEAPDNHVHPTTVYKGNVDEIGILTDEEIDLITEFYTSIISFNKEAERHQELMTRVSMSSDHIDIREGERQRVLTSQIEKATVKRWKATQVIKKNLGEEYKPIDRMEIPNSAGETISKDHPLFWDQPNKYVVEGYFSLTEPESDMYELTKEGEEWLEDRDTDEAYNLDHELSLA